MKDKYKTKLQLIDELEEIRQRNSELNALLEKRADINGEHYGDDSSTENIFKKLISKNLDVTQASELINQKLVSAEYDSYSRNLFFTNLNHQIRTAMNGIIGLTEISIAIEQGAKQEQYLFMVKNSALLLLTFFNDLIDFLKMESGLLKLEHIEFNLRETVENVSDFFIQQLIEKKLLLHLFIHENVPNFLIGDPDRLKRILINLVNNVIKITDKGEIIIEVQVAELEKNQAVLHFSVINSGPELSNLQFQNSVDNFIKMDREVENQLVAIDLGLNVAGKLMDKMGCRIWKEKKDDNLNTFNFSSRFDIQQILEEQTEPLNFTINNPRILVISKIRMTRVILKEMLQSHECEMSEAETIDQALELLEKKIFHSIILEHTFLDQKLSNLLTRIRRHNNYENIPITVLTSLRKYEEKVELDEFDYLWFVNTPIKYNKLIEKLQLALGASPYIDNISRLSELKDNVRILLVEDIYINQRVILALLEKTAILVDVADDGYFALEALQKNKYDLVLMDVQMPGMDGFVTTGKIRNELKLMDLPIIALTAYSTQEDKEQCMLAGMNDYLSKPVEPDEFYKLLDKWLIK